MLVVSTRIMFGIIAATIACGSSLADEKSRRDIKEGMADRKEEAAYKLGVEVTRHMGVAVDGKPAHQKESSKPSSSSSSCDGKSGGSSSCRSK